MKSSTKRTLTIFFALVLFIVSFLVYSYLIKPAYDEVESLRAKNISLIDNYNNYKILDEQFKSSMAGNDNLSGDNQLSLILPLKVDTGYVLSQLTGLAKVNNLYIASLNANEASIKPSAGPLIKSVGSLRATARVSGDYSSLKSFFQSLENNMLIFSPVSLSIESQSGASGAVSSILNYSIVVDSYYQTQ